jgi:ankyrin repeat protein
MADIHECAAGDIEGVLLALAAGGDVDARLPRTGRTGLMEAVSGGARNFEVVRLLLSRGADVNAVANARRANGLGAFH